ncbi:MAG: hypothetical protein R3E79_38100 [Caldilineaceae bacterium]
MLILDPTRFLIDITGDERDDPPSAQEGNNDKLSLVGVIDSASNVIKFEHQLIISADDAQAIPGAEAGAGISQNRLAKKDPKSERRIRSSCLWWNGRD